MRGSVPWARFLVFRLSLSLLSGCLGPASAPVLPALDAVPVSVAQSADTRTHHQAERRSPLRSCSAGSPVLASLPGAQGFVFRPVSV